MLRTAFNKTFGICRITTGCFYCTKHITKQKEIDSQWKPVIGLEIHAQISANSKLFSGSAAQFAAPVNNQVSAFDAALPGTLPAVNRRCVEAGVQTALALQCHVNMESEFDRKHYFYADLPTGYQITQQRHPLAVGGHVEYPLYKEDKSKVRAARLVQLQLEQDSGKSLHDEEMSISLIDLNRAGIGLMEIITEPDFSSSAEAVSFVKELQLILQTIGTCDGRMDEGSLRVDASVSVHQPNSPLGVRAEVKNLNSISALGKAIDFEIARQIDILDAGGEVVNETRAFNIDTGKTVSMRDKERLHDYRFMPEPNLPPLRLYTVQTVPAGVPSEQIINVDRLRDQMPELPSAQRARLQQTYGLSLDHSTVLVSEPGLVDSYEAVVKGGRSTRITCNVCIIDMFTALNKQYVSFRDSQITAEHIGQVVDMVTSNIINRKRARQVFEVLMKNISKTPKQIVDENNWSLVTDKDVLEEICLRVLANNEEAVAKYKRGRTKVLNFFMTEVQNELDGRADGKVVGMILQQHLSSDK